MPQTSAKLSNFASAPSRAIMVSRRILPARFLSPWRYERDSLRRRWRRSDSVGLGCRDCSRVMCGMAGFGETNRGARANNQGRTGEMRGGHGRSRDMNEMNGLGEHGSRRHLDHNAVLHQSRVQCDDRLPCAKIFRKILRRQQRDQIWRPSVNTQASELTFIPSGKPLDNSGAKKPSTRTRRGAAVSPVAANSSRKR